MSELYFTYYGDLVGIKALYKKGSQSAYNKLSDYYNTVFHGLEAYHSANKDNRKVTMFSDSLLVTGDDPAAFIRALAPVYNTLAAKELLLRGGMVKGRLTKDARLETSNFEKFLPDSDVLARAASMESEVKGARFLLDHQMAKLMIQPKAEWLTIEGYESNPDEENRDLAFQRSIVPVKDCDCYEILYPLLDDLEGEIYARRIAQLAKLEEAVPEHAKPHYSETSKVFECSKKRLLHRGVEHNDSKEPWKADVNPPSEDWNKHFTKKP